MKANNYPKYCKARSVASKNVIVIDNLPFMSTAASVVASATGKQTKHVSDSMTEVIL